MTTSESASSSLDDLLTNGVFPAGCPSRTLLDHIVSKWGVLVLVSLAERPHRWSELRRRAEGISEKMLAQTLKTLEADGLVLRHQEPVMPPRVDYSLTPAGAEVAGLMRPLLQWVGRQVETRELTPAHAGSARSAER